MTTPALLAPLSTVQPCGDDLSFSTEFDAIAEMRREDDPTLDQGEWVAALKTADWPGVARACEAILGTRSKDLRVAGWLADAWARLRGFDGLADGIELSAGLVETFWDELHPRIEDGDVEQRVGNLRWLAARVVALVPGLALVLHNGRRHTLAEVVAARSARLAASAAGSNGSSSGSHGPGSSSSSGGHGASGAPAPATLEAILRDVAAGGREAASARRAAVVRARTALAHLQACADVRLGDDAPSFVGAREALDQAVEELARLDREAGVAERGAAVGAGDALGATPGNDESTGGVDTAGGIDPVIATTAAAHQPSALPARITSRAQAVEQLRRVAEWFRNTEPHSPVAYLADKAVHWSDMPLHEWLRAVMKDGASLAHVEELLGIDKRAE